MMMMLLLLLLTMKLYFLVARVILNTHCVLVVDRQHRWKSVAAQLGQVEKLLWVQQVVLLAKFLHHIDPWEALHLEEVCSVHYS